MRRAAALALLTVGCGTRSQGFEGDAEPEVEAGAASDAASDAQSDAAEHAVCNPVTSQSWRRASAGSSDCGGAGHACRVDFDQPSRCGAAGRIGWAQRCGSQDDCRAGFFCAPPPWGGHTCCAFCPAGSQGAADGTCPGVELCCAAPGLPDGTWLCHAAATCPTGS